MSRVYTSDAIDGMRAKWRLPGGKRSICPITYLWPGNAAWDKYLKLGDLLGFVVLNRTDGQWETYDKVFHEQGRKALAAGARRVIFYITTQFGVAALPPDSPEHKKFDMPVIATKEFILQQIMFIKKHYPDIFGGVFFDAVIPGLPQEMNRVPWYQEVMSAVRASIGPEALIVANTAVGVKKSMILPEIDIFADTEFTAEVYLQQPDWGPQVADYQARTEGGRRFMHVVHGITEQNVEEVFALAERYGVQHIFFTDQAQVSSDREGGHPYVSPYRDAPSPWMMDRMRRWAQPNVEPLAKRLEALERKVAALGG